MNDDQEVKEEKITEEDSLGRIRDIILGERFQELERELESLENQVVEESAKLNADIQKLRLNFEIYIEATLKSLSKKLDQNKEEHVNFTKEASAEFKSLHKLILENKESTDKELSTINKIIIKNKEEVKKDFEKINKQLLKNKEDFDKRIKHTVEELKKEYLKELSAIKQKIVSRNNLASLLSELSVQLEDKNTNSGK